MGGRASVDGEINVGSEPDRPGNTVKFSYKGSAKVFQACLQAIINAQVANRQAPNIPQWNETPKDIGESFDLKE
jgi:hypothetical protein